jgi:hypothetical protein
MIRIKLRNKDFKAVRTHLKENRKIAAIKHLRNSGVDCDDPRAVVTLKSAKYAIDSLVSGIPSEEVRLVPEWTVHSLQVSGECGKIEVDLETLQMHFLSSLDTLGLDEVGHLLELVDYIRQWQSRDFSSTRKDVRNED